MVSLLSSVCPIKKYSIEHSFVPLICSSESFVISYDEIPRPLVRLFNSHSNQVMCLYLPTMLVDICYSSEFDSFVLLSTTAIYKLNPSIGTIESIDNYELLKENRSMSSICSTNDRRLLILYRFGEYLDTYPKGKRIWKRRHLCDSISEDIFLIRSSKSKDCLVGLLIVEWNGTWRVDIFSSSMHKLHSGFRFTGWTRETWLSDWSPLQCWFVGSTHRVLIDTQGQPVHILDHRQDSPSLILNMTWMSNSEDNRIKMIVTRERTSLTFFK